MKTTPAGARLETGILDDAMASNIAAAGLPVRVCNRSREKADRLEDVAQGAGAVLGAVKGAPTSSTVLWTPPP